MRPGAAGAAVAPVAPVAAVATVVLDGEAVVLERTSGRVHRFNTSGTRIWTHLDGTATAGEIAAALGAPLGDVETFIARLVHLGLVA